MVFWLPLLFLQSTAVERVVVDSTRIVVPGIRYQAGAVHRFFLGDTHRQLWTTPLRIPVLDLATHAGGLEAMERGGSKQSRSLRFRAGDGRTFTFRSLDKDPTQTWPELLRNSPARGFAEDQISAILPAGALAVAVLEEAAGIFQTVIRLVVLPDDPRLGQWRSEFANMPGIIEQRIRGTTLDLAALPGAKEVVTSEELFRRLRDHGHHAVDQPRFLAARLLDLIVGDWDRHAGQWAWIRFDEGGRSRWAPLPRDRDWALSRLDGPLYGLLRLYLPKYQSFSDRYGSVYGLTLSAEGLDRRLLVGLERASWDSTVADLQGRLTNDVIDRAIANLPAEFPREAVAGIGNALRRRRDELPMVAASFYRQLADEVELRGSAEADDVTLEFADSTVGLTMADQAGNVRWRRRFHHRETEELRLMVYGGDDRVTSVGRGRSRIRVRLVDEGGRLAIDSVSARAVQVFDASDRYQPPVDPQDPLRIHRDWGHLFGVAPWFEARPEVGMLLGAGPVVTTYGFRKVPYSSRIAARAAFATRAGGVNVDVNGDFRFARPDRRLLVRAALLGTDVVRYFGFGNETVRSDEVSFHQTRQRLLMVEPKLVFDLGASVQADVGGFFRRSNTDVERATLLAAERPYGSGQFAEVGLSAGLTADTRDHPVYPTRGFRGEVSVRVVPGLLDATEAFGGVDARGSFFATAATLPASPTLAVRAGVSRDWGRVPFFDASSIGGRGSVRGLNSHRFLGEAALFGGVEVRLDLGHFTVLVPGDWGVYGLVDGGRVYAGGEASNRWHTATGGGLWFAFLERKSTMTLTYAGGRERSRWYLQAGFHF